MTAELPEGADPAPCSGLTYPPCECPEHSRAGDADDSPILARLRERVRKESSKRREFGQLGRLL
ncbi:hypothetical protein GCM10009753_65090 [Streptantibioticus ferralitis]